MSRATATPIAAAQSGRAKTRCRGESPMTLPVRRSMKRSGGAQQRRAGRRAANAVCVRSRITAPPTPRTRKTAKVQPPPPANDSSARPSCAQASPGPARDSSPSTPTVKRSARRRSATANGSSRSPTASDGQRGPQRAPAPDGERHGRLDRHHDRAVRMHGREEHCRERGDERRPARPQLERTGEEVGRERADEGEQRVHPPHRPVEREHRRRGGHEGGGRAGHRPGEAAPEVVAERDRGDARRRPRASGAPPARSRRRARRARGRSGAERRRGPTAR